MGVKKEMRAGDRAYATLLNEIQDGVLAPGMVLVEAEQAMRLGVSRTPMREAIGKLVSAGLAHQQSPRTTVVSGFDIEDIKRLFEARRALEETAARLAAERADRAIFRELADSFAATHVASAQGTPEVLETDEYYSLIAKFDEELDAAVDNAYLVSALRVIRTHLVRARRLARDNPDRLAISVAEHRLIAHAIAEGDADLAAHATHVHLHNALQSILDSLNT